VVFDRHAGSFTVYVYGIAPVVSASLIGMVQERINDRAAFPITGVAVNPDLVGVSLVSTLRLSQSPSAVEKEIILNTATLAAEEYINNLRVGEPLIINEIADRIRNADARILDVGEPNRQIPEIFLWRSRSDGSRYSRFLVANYTLAAGERIGGRKSRPFWKIPILSKDSVWGG